MCARWRYGDTWKQPFRYVNRQTEYVFTPDVGDDCEILLFPDSGNLSRPAKRIYLNVHVTAHVENCGLKE